MFLSEKKTTVTVNFLLLVLKCLKFNFFMLQSQKINNKCLVLSRYPPIQTLNFLEQHYVCYSVRISQNLINEVPVERSVPADVANYHLNNSFKEKLN